MKLWIAIPSFNEADFLPITIKSILNQTIQNFEVVICVNQPDEWWNIENKADICVNNSKTIDYIRSLDDTRFKIIDKSSQGFGFDNKHSGVGMARKTIGDRVIREADRNDIMVITDADTTFDNNYLEEIINCFTSDKDIVGLAAPYYHNLTGNNDIDRAILRYEIYMRCYALNMYLINSRYAPTAIGSALAVKCGAYSAVGGITPYRSGEDFYFLQKLIKFGKISTKCKSRVYPASRLSNRVDFGTGPAMIKGMSGDWSSYPIYDPSIFEEVEITYRSFSQIFETDIDTPMTNFLKQQLSSENLWEPLRKNFKTKDKFIRACSEKVDGLRIFQYLKQRQKELCIDDNTALHNLISKLNIDNINRVDLQIASVDELNNLRDELSTALFRLENQHS